MLDEFIDAEKDSKNSGYYKKEYVTQLTLDWGVCSQMKIIDLIIFIQTQ